MDKEKVVTILIGLVVGAGLASAYFLSSKFLPKGIGLPKQEIITTQKPPQPQNSSKAFTIDQPDDNISTTGNSVTVAGKAPTGQMLVIFANADEKVASVSADGVYNANIKLEEGVNEISVTTIDPSGKPTTLKREIIMEITP